MLHTLAETRSTRKVLWLHSARDRHHHVFAGEVRHLMAALVHGRSYVCYSRLGSDEEIGKDGDAVGRLSRSVFEEVGVPRDSDVYICGPNLFMTEMRTALLNLGLSSERIRIEIFNGGESLTPGVVSAESRLPHPPKDEAKMGPLVSFARSGVAAHWGTAGYQSILELAEACDVPVRWACRTGVCHNCESGLISGAVVYAPDPLDQPANGNLLICCSQPADDVVIDL
jgi:ferredoxin-NADP reductase